MNHKYIIIFCLPFIIFACESRRSGEEKQENEELNRLPRAREIGIEPYGAEAEFPDAILEMTNPAEYQRLNPGKTTFSYNVKNFDLASGASIVLNLNNSRFIEKQTVEFQTDLEEGAYLSLSFLATKDGFALKNYGNYVVRSFTVGNSDEIDDTRPMLMYNQPRGRVRLDEEDGAPLDFFLLNAELSANGHKVKIEIGGREFVLDEWRRYRIRGLGRGEHRIKLSLIGPDGKIADSPFGQAEQAFTLY